MLTNSMLLESTPAGTQELLAETDLSLAQIALRSGFSDQSHFSPVEKLVGPTSQTSTASTAATDSLSACPDLSGTAGTTASGTVPDPASSQFPTQHKLSAAVRAFQCNALILVRVPVLPRPAVR
jgi:AraC-like DNA-binding protein